MLDALTGCVSYWSVHVTVNIFMLTLHYRAIGWGLAYGDNGNVFCGGSQFFNYHLPYDQYPKWFFQVRSYDGFNTVRVIQGVPK